MTSPSRRARLDAARHERRALDAWAKAGRPGPRPRTPTLDELATEQRRRARADR